MLKIGDEFKFTYYSLNPHLIFKVIAIDDNNYYCQPNTDEASPSPFTKNIINHYVRIGEVKIIIDNGFMRLVKRIFN